MDGRVILDESRPEQRDRELNLYDADNPHQPPYSTAYLDRIGARRWPAIGASLHG